MDLERPAPPPDRLAAPGRWRVLVPLAAVVLTAVALGAGCAPEIEPPAPPPPAVLIPPLHDAEVGERIVLRRGLEEHVYTVVEAGDADIEVEVQKYLGGEAEGPPQSHTWSRNGFGLPPGTVIRRIERARVELADRPWDCWLFHVHSRKGQFYAYISEEAPVHGILRMMRTDGGRPDMRTMLELVPEDE